MLKSLEMKAEIKSLREEIQALIDQKKAVPVEMQNKLQDALSAYEKQLEVEAAAKNSKNKGENKGENNMDKKSFNAALKSYLLGIKNEDTAKFFNTATGQNGAVDADGGVLIPSELLDLKENNGINNDLRSLTTAISVGTRSGSVPIIDYSQTVTLTDFDENNAIAETKAVFTSTKFNLASKGAIIPVSRELLMDAKTDVMAVIGKLFNRVYVKAVNKEILSAAKAAVDATAKTVTAVVSKEGLDAIKAAVISLPLDAGANATIVMNQKTFAAMAVVSDKEDRYLLTRDANGSTIRQLEGRPVIVVENDELGDNTVLVGDFRAIYHIAYPELEVAADESAGFRNNSVLVRAICRFTDINTYTAAFTVIKQGA